jgi:RNA polymerase-binding transcription factor
MIEVAAETLRPVELALVRLEPGWYGTCVDCGEPIATARLFALPFAARCQACETVREADTQTDFRVHQHRERVRSLILAD